MSESMGGPITHWDGCWRDRWHWACAQTQIMKLTAKLEAMERACDDLRRIANIKDDEFRLMEARRIWVAAQEEEE